MFHSFYRFNSCKCSFTINCYRVIFSKFLPGKKKAWTLYAFSIYVTVLICSLNFFCNIMENLSLWPQQASCGIHKEKKHGKQLEQILHSFTAFYTSEFITNTAEGITLICATELPQTKHHVSLKSMFKQAITGLTGNSFNAHVLLLNSITAWWCTPVHGIPLMQNFIQHAEFTHSPVHTALMEQKLVDILKK